MHSLHAFLEIVSLPRATVVGPSPSVLVLRAPVAAPGGLTGAARSPLPPAVRCAAFS